MKISYLFKSGVIIILLTSISCSTTNKNSDLLNGYLSRGHMYYRAGGFENCQRARIQYSKALNIDPTNVEALLSLGNIYYLFYEYHLYHNNRPAALDSWNYSYNCFNESLKYKPDYPEPYFGLATLNFCIRKYDEGIKLLNKVLSLPLADIITQAEAHKRLGRLYNAQEKHKEALRELKEYLRILPEAEDAIYIKKAIRELEKSITSSPKKDN